MLCSEHEALVMGFETHSAGLSLSCPERVFESVRAVGNMFPHFCRKSFLIVVHMGVK